MYLRQDFVSHDGCILAMKFSPDGKRLATGGQDGTLRVWDVVEDQGSDELDVLGLDQSYLYVSASGVANVDSFNKIKKLKKLPEKVCIISPKKFFRIPETPLHEFHDHEGAVLDLSWSANGVSTLLVPHKLLACCILPRLLDSICLHVVTPFIYCGYTQVK